MVAVFQPARYGISTSAGDVRKELIANFTYITCPFVGHMSHAPIASACPIGVSINWFAQHSRPRRTEKTFGYL